MRAGGLGWDIYKDGEVNKIRTTQNGKVTSEPGANALKAGMVQGFGGDD